MAAEQSLNERIDHVPIPKHSGLLLGFLQQLIKKRLTKANELENFSTIVPVVAVALIDSAGRVLMQRRRLDSAYGGLWEFPGGKVEAAETPVIALIREISEELGVTLAAEELSPLTFATDPAQPHVILLYTCRSWSGEPQCLDGEEIAWFAPEALSDLAMPPLDIPLSKALQLLMGGGQLLLR